MIKKVSKVRMVEWELCFWLIQPKNHNLSTKTNTEGVSRVQIWDSHQKHKIILIQQTSNDKSRQPISSQSSKKTKEMMP